MDGGVSISATPTSTCVTSNRIALYEFTQGSGSVVNDVSGYGSALNLSIANANVTWLSGRGLRINSATRIFNANGSKLRTAINSSGQMTVEAWVKPSNTTQTGPARIVTYSQDISNRNFTLGQLEATYAWRLRTNTDGGDNNGNPTRVAGSVNTASPQHIVATWNVNTGAEHVYVNGIQVYSGTRSGNPSNWIDNYDFSLANEQSNDRAWLGTFYQVAVYDRALSSAEVLENYGAGYECESSCSLVVSLSASNVSCNGNADGEVQATPIGGVPPYSYVWNVNGSEDHLHDVGRYLTVVVTDGNGCTATASAQVNQPAILVATPEVIHESFAGESDGRFILRRHRWHDALCLPLE
ncbi:MAG: LamG-like jellyroll fold domain-containing protein [Saprospiraceae bacterium]